MNDIWEETWDIVSETFRRIASSLSVSYPKISWSSGHSDNKSFPFRAYATFNQGSQGSEDVVVSIDFRRFEEKLLYSTDIGRDDGSVLADGPTGTIDVSEGVEAARTEIEAAVSNIVRFLDVSGQVVSAAINQQAQ